MANESKAYRLHQHMAHMVALEAGIEKTLEQQLIQVGDHSEVAAAIRDFHEMAGGQRQALKARLHTVGENIAIPDRAVGESGDGNGYPASTALRCAYVALNEAIIGYTMLRILALRFRDSPVTGEENTAALAEQHIRNYVGAVRRISQLLHDVVVWELEREGHNCKCTCACCGLGVCICATYNRETLSNAWAEAGPIADESEVLVLPPKPGSAAADAGLQHGDVIVAADGLELESYGTLYEVADGHQSGETIELRVRRRSGELADISVVRP